MTKKIIPISKPDIRVLELEALVRHINATASFDTDQYAGHAVLPSQEWEQADRQRKSEVPAPPPPDEH